MAEDKKGFILYADYEELFEELSDEDAGQLVKHLFRYVNDRNPETENKLVKVSFIPIKRQLKRDLQKYEDKRKQWSEAGKKSAALRKQRANNDLQRPSTTLKSVATDSTVNVNDNVNVIVNDSVIVKKDIKERKLSFHSKVFIENKNIDPKDLTDFCDYWTEHGENDKKMRFEKEKSFDINLRLKKWIARKNNFKTEQKINYQKDSSFK